MRGLQSQILELSGSNSRTPTANCNFPRLARNAAPWEESVAKNNTLFTRCPVKKK